MLHNLKKTIEYGLYLLVFLLPWQTRWIIKAGKLNDGYWEYGTISLYITDVVLIALLLIFLFYYFKTKKFEISNWKFGNGNDKTQITNYKLPITTIWYLIAGLELFVFISIFFAPDKLLALFGYGRFLLGVGLFWLVLSAPYDKIKLIYSLLAGASLSAGLGIWQFLTQSSFASKWLGLALHDPADLGTSVVETISGGRWLRAYGSLDHPNVLGGLLVVGILLLVGLIICKNNKIFEGETTSSRFQKFYFPLLLSVYCLLFTAVFFTFSRSAWLGLATGFIVMFIVATWQKQKEILMRLLKILIMSAIMLVILINLYPNLVKTRLSGDARLEVKSNIERLESYGTAKEIINNHWLFGAGINNYTLAVHNELNPDREAWYYQPVHNVFLLVWAETGIFGLIFLILLLCVMCYVLCKKQEKIVKLNYFYISLLPAILILFLFDHYLWSLHFGIFLFCLVTGIIYRNLRNIHIK